MIVECVSNAFSSVAADSLLGVELRQWGTRDRTLALSVGHLYTVYAIEFRGGHPWYYLADDDFDVVQYPNMYASAFFQEIDNRISSCWTFGFTRVLKDRCNAANVLITFKAWSEDRMFFEHLIDGFENETRIFQAYKEYMDLEYPFASVTEKAEMLDDKWLMCPRCTDSWESKSCLGMLRCPVCSVLLLNPRYSRSNTPPGYVPGEGTGFLPGEAFP